MGYYGGGQPSLVSHEWKEVYQSKETELVLIPLVPQDSSTLVRELYWLGELNFPFRWEYKDGDLELCLGHLLQDQSWFFFH